MKYYISFYRDLEDTRVDYELLHPITAKSDISALDIATKQAAAWNKLAGNSEKPYKYVTIYRYIPQSEFLNEETSKTDFGSDFDIY